ncbi:MAG: RNA polymerase [Bacteroidetes bacterium]|nr:sigma-70 family RNA polymerase sigma factor [Bacteroidia bacterium]PCH67894.1 MAG: RNA polymerase [Bacteroidota bacterium]
MDNNLETTFFGALEKNKDRIFRMCRAYSTDNENAKDLFQDVVLQIWKSLPSFKELSTIDTWIYRITLNVCIRANLQLKKREDKTVRLDSIHFENLESGSNDNFEEREKYKPLYGCISKLSETDRSIILLFLEDLSYKEISSVTGLTENHVAVKLKRIKKKLFNCLNQ